MAPRAPDEAYEVEFAGDDAFDVAAMKTMLENADFFEVIGKNKDAYQMLKDEMFTRYLIRHQGK